MSKGLDKFLSGAGQIIGAAADATGTAVEKGKTKVEEVSLRKKMSDAQKRLGAVVYNQTKTGQPNEEAIAMIIAEIDTLQEELSQLKKQADTSKNVKYQYTYTAQTDTVEQTEGGCECEKEAKTPQNVSSGDEKDAMFCCCSSDKLSEK